MPRTIEVEIDAEGRVHPLDPTATLPKGRAVLAWLDPAEDPALLLAELSLAEAWLSPDEDAAWAYLQLKN